MTRPLDALHLTVPAAPGYLFEIRRLLNVFAVEAGAGEDKRTDILLAVNEACTNVVRHAYGEEGGPLHVNASHSPGALVVQVSDNGTPVAIPTRNPGAGLGLSLVQRLSDDVDIEGPGEGGTRLEMTFRLPGPDG